MLPERETILVPCSRTAQEPPLAWLYLLILPLLTSRAFAAAPAPVDLNTFDALKRSVTLANGQSLAYVPLGNPAGPAVVLIHGYTDNARDWVPMLPYLSKRFRLILVDLRGHGQSSKPECCYTRVDFAYDIKLLLDALRSRSADIVGHSLGQHHRQTFAEYWPERTNRVVLIASQRRPAPAPPHRPANSISPPRSASSRSRSIPTRRS